MKIIEKIAHIAFIALSICVVVLAAIAANLP
jgi:hypothetical protein